MALTPHRRRMTGPSPLPDPMPNLVLRLLGVFLCGLSAVAAQASDKEPTANIRDRFSLRSDDGLSSISLNGRFQLDNDFYDGAYNVRGNGGASENEIRRARLGVEGRIDGEWDYEFVLNVDDDEQTADIDTASLTYTGLDLADISLGRFKRPVGFEQITSSKWLLTIERALIFDAIPHHNTSQMGLMLDGAWGPFHAYLGAFDANVEDIQTDEDQYGLYGRLTWAQLNDDETRVLHLGLSAADQNPSARSVTTITSRFGVHTLPPDQFQFVNELNPARERVAEIEVNRDRQAGLEAAAVFGPLSLSAEYLLRDVGLVAGREVRVRGGYLTVAWALTGEVRRYDRESGGFGSILRPGHRRNGAWELVAKVDQVEAGSDADANVLMGTLGLNWSPKLNLKFMLNYLRFKSEGLAAGNDFQDEGSAITSRIQFHF